MVFNLYQRLPESSNYFSQAIFGQLELFPNFKAIEKLLQQHAVDDETKSQLKKILKIRNLTQELGLKNNKSYLNYSDIKRKYVVWNVFVTPALSLDAEQWCFPFAGCVTYRGYFKRNKSKRFLEKKKAEGMDVFLTGVSAYSTLGWFSDPVLNTFVNYSDIDLVRLFHELAHQIVYVKDDTTFNESFAVCIENEGVKRWLRANGSEADRAVWKEHLLSKKISSKCLNKKKDKLTILYKSNKTDSIKLREKAIIFNQLRAQYKIFRQKWPRENRYDSLFSQTLNNAVFLVAIANYSQYVPFFRNLLDKKGFFQVF